MVAWKDKWAVEVEPLIAEREKVRPRPKVGVYAVGDLFGRIFMEGARTSYWFRAWQGRFLGEDGDLVLT